jgi:hypothetical protein
MTKELEFLLTATGKPVVRITNEDLQPAIKKGWCALIEPDKAPAVGEYVLIKYRNGHSSIKVLLEIKPDGYLLQSATCEAQNFAPFSELKSTAIAIGGIFPPSHLTNVSCKIH